MVPSLKVLGVQENANIKGFSTANLTTAYYKSSEVLPSQSGRVAELVQSVRKFPSPALPDTV